MAKNLTKKNKKEEVTIVLGAEQEVTKEVTKEELNTESPVEVTVDNDTVETNTNDLEEKLSFAGIVINDSAPKVIPQKMVKIKANKRHQCFIGGEWYHLEEGKQYHVPKEVKDRLLTAGILAPL